MKLLLVTFITFLAFGINGCIRSYASYHDNHSWGKIHTTVSDFDGIASVYMTKTPLLPSKKRSNPARVYVGHIWHESTPHYADFAIYITSPYGLLEIDEVNLVLDDERIKLSETVISSNLDHRANVPCLDTKCKEAAHEYKMKFTYTVPLALLKRLNDDSANEAYLSITTHDFKLCSDIKRQYNSVPPYRAVLKKFLATVAEIHAKQ